MIKIFNFMILTALLNFNVFATKIDIDYIRLNYQKSVENKKLCSEMIKYLTSIKTDATHLAYLGGLQTIWANHVNNPLNKLSTFNEGKKNIEKAVLIEPTNIEVRYIRLSVQTNAPSFLGYNSYIITDKQFLKKYRTETTSVIVRKNIDILLND